MALLRGRSRAPLRQADNLRLSVAMATYNGARHVRAQLESIAGQTRPPDELVVHDDASTDATVQIVREFAATAPFPVRLRVNDARLGYAENFLSAMQACSGEIVAVSDQDDVWLAQKLRHTLWPFLQDPRVALVGHGAAVVDEDLRPLGSQYPRVPRLTVHEPGRAGPVWGGFPGFALAYRASHAWYAGTGARPHWLPPDERNLIPHDVWLSLTCSCLGRVVALPQTLALYRRHGANTSTFSPPGRLARLRASLALREEERQFFERVAAAVADRGRYLEGLRPFADALDPSARAGLEHALLANRRYAAAMHRRALAYRAASGPQRITRVVRSAATGDYRARSAGGLGGSSLVRDLALAVVPPSHD